MSVATRMFDAVADWFGTVRSASAVVGAIESGRRPDSRDLRRLGIDPRTFLSIGHG